MYEFGDSLCRLSPNESRSVVRCLSTLNKKGETIIHSSTMTCEKGWKFTV